MGDLGKNFPNSLGCGPGTLLTLVHAFSAVDSLTLSLGFDLLWLVEVVFRDGTGQSPLVSNAPSLKWQTRHQAFAFISAKSKDSWF